MTDPLPSADKAPTSPRTWPTYLFLGSCLVLAHALAVYLLVPEVTGGSLIDPDSYTRLIRVRELMEGEGWFDGVIGAMNAPYGLELHWTRPLDLVLLFGTLLLTPFLGLQPALHWAGVLVSPGLHIVTCLLLAWAVAPLFAKGHRPLVVLVFLMQPLVLNYAYAGRADHHMLLLLLWVLSLGCYLRAVSGSRRGSLSLAGGALAGLGLWVSIEFLLPLLTLYLPLVILWVVKRPGAAENCVTFSAGLAGMAALGLLAEYPPSELSSPVYDRLSIPHVVLLGTALVFWLVTRRLEGIGRVPESVRGRLALLVLAGMLVLVPTSLLFPGLVVSPVSDLDPRFEVLLMGQIEELQAAFPASLAEVGTTVARFGHVVFAVPFLISAFLPRRDWAARAAWLPVVVALALFVPLGLYQLRYAMWAAVPVAVGATGCLVAMLQELRGPGTGRMLGRASITTGILLTPLFLGGLLLQVWGDRTPPPPRAGAGGGDCSVQQLAFGLSQGEYGEESRIIVAHPNIGPELVYRTPHRVVAAPYHRNVEGVLDVYDMMAATDDQTARALMAEREVYLLALCPLQDGWFLQQVERPRESLYWRLTNEEPPSWLGQIDVPGLASSGFLVFRVRDR